MTELVEVEDALSRRRQRTSPLYAGRVEVYAKAVRGPLSGRSSGRAIAVLLAIYYLRAVAALGPRPGRARPGGAGRSGQPALLLLLHRDLAAGNLLPDRPADHGARSALFLVTSAVRPRLVRLCLPADGVDRPVHAGRAPDRGRPQRSACSSTPAPWTLDKVVRKVAKHAVWLVIAAATGGAWIIYFVDAPTLRARASRPAQRRARGLFLHRPVHRHDLSAGRLGARAGLHLHVPVAALPGGDARRAQRCIVTYQDWRGEPRGKHKKGERLGRRAATASIATPASRSARPASTSATASSSNASAAACASTPATT